MLSALLEKPIRDFIVNEGMQANFLALRMGNNFRVLHAESTAPLIEESSAAGP